MYSLPITTYSDYWRKTKALSVYFGSLAVLAAGTRYSSLYEADSGKTLKPSVQLVDSISLKSVRTNDFPEGTQTVKKGSESLVKQGLNKPRQISRGFRGFSPQESSVLDESASRSLNLQSGDIESRTSKIAIVDMELPFKTEFVESEKIPPGTSQIQVKGENGTRRQVIKTFEIGGQPVDQQVQSFYELKKPKNEVVLRNTQPIPKKKVIIDNSKLEAGKLELDLSKLSIAKTINVEATAYTFTGNNTATGIKPREGLIAVDPRVIAMGSQVYVEGYGYAIAADTGGNIRGHKIDVFFSTLRQCIDWGRKPVRIHILNTK
ncbi:3D domain-containing protein [Desulfosporosinus hippei]|uniref:3D (Asp-Asp-Asp) domain-containing protein n=1 Tax=Desulfosporosinus hippei DSM 8344 TaxID=1121419 RepID=A0A1G7WYE8_9FIRM|nr:3D domain-containing protein [Desulfosporosinus hippei]SDG76924.1 3D (Asp-Asp-Asp) domain-containing protein [Desulfosporosinus hippei DSM 8344]